MYVQSANACLKMKHNIGNIGVPKKLVTCILVLKIFPYVKTHRIVRDEMDSSQHWSMSPILFDLEKSSGQVRMSRNENCWVLIH